MKSTLVLLMFLICALNASASKLFIYEKGDSIYLPLEYLVDRLGYKYEYDRENRSLTIDKEKQEVFTLVTEQIRIIDDVIYCSQNEIMRILPVKIKLKYLIIWVCT